MEKIKNFASKNWLLFVIIAYIISPVDIIPDAIPIAGITDDLLLLIIQIINMIILYFKDRNKVETIETEKITAKKVKE